MWPVVIAAGISAASALYAQAQQAKGSKEQKKLLDEAANEIMKVAPPDPAEQKKFLQTLKSQGVLTPKLEEAIAPISSAYNDIKSDSTLRDAQKAALTKLQTVGESGLNFEDKAALQDIQDQNAGIERGQRAAIMQNMAARGMGGSGAELANQLAAQQGAADRNARSSLNVAAQAQRRALDAMQRSGELAGSIRGQDFSEAARKADAIDSIQRFNAANSIGLQQRNVGRANQAAAANLSEKQRIADDNVKIGMKNIDINQAGYDNALQKANAVAGVKSGLGNVAVQRGQNAANAAMGVGNAVASGVNAYGNYQAAKDNRAEDREFLKELYKNKEDQSY